MTDFNVTVTEFLYRNYKDCDGNELFTYIYPVALGVREMLVQHRHAQEVIELCKVLKEDMFLYMSIDAAEEIFENVDQIAEKSINHTKWGPFLTPTNYQEAYDEPSNLKSDTDRKHYKRTNKMASHKVQNMSYAQTVKSAATNIPNVSPQPHQQDQGKHSSIKQREPRTS
jgi:hypothetical protein